MSRLEYFFESAARNAAEVISLDEERRKAFVKGVEWTLTKLEEDIYLSHHPMASPSDNAYFDKLTLAGIKKFILKMKERGAP
jgi:hypothetical protein